MDDSYEKFAGIAKQKLDAFGPKAEPSEGPDAEQLSSEQQELLSKVKSEIEKSPAFKAAIKAC